MPAPITVAARVLFACLTLAAVVTQLIDIVDKDLSAANFLSFFTIQSNLIAAFVLVYAAWRLLRRRHSDRDDLLRGAATLYMSITGVVYVALLRNVDVQTSQAWINTVLHYVMPVVMVADWVVNPVRRVPTRRQSALWLAYPLAYLVYSLVRGRIVDWYPYPFLDPRTKGYVAVAVAAVGVLLLAIVAILALLKVAAIRTRTATR